MLMAKKEADSVIPSRRGGSIETAGSSRMVDWPVPFVIDIMRTKRVVLVHPFLAGIGLGEVVLPRISPWLRPVHLTGWTAHCFSLSPVEQRCNQLGT